MPKKPAKKVVKRAPRKDASQTALGVVLQATGLSELKQTKPTKKRKA